MTDDAVTDDAVTHDAATATPSPGDEPALVLDQVGRRCPLPVLELARRIAEVPVGSVVEVRCDDPAAAVDVPAWAGMRDHEYAGAVPREGWVGYRVRRLR